MDVLLGLLSGFAVLLVASVLLAQVGLIGGWEVALLVILAVLVGVAVTRRRRKRHTAVAT